MIKTFRGLLADAAQDRIRLSTIKGKVGYRIVKFQVLAEKTVNNLSGGTADFVVQIWKREISSVPTSTATFNFSDSDLLAAAGVMMSGSGDPVYSMDGLIIFDNEIFNQDIYITNTDNAGSDSINYYLELEVVPLDDAGAEYTTLKDMR